MQVNVSYWDLENVGEAIRATLSAWAAESGKPMPKIKGSDSGLFVDADDCATAYKLEQVLRDAINKAKSARVAMAHPTT